MIPQAITQDITLEDGRIITLETGKLAKQADGSVVIKMGGTMILATVVSSKKAKEGIDFLPLTVEYKEKFAASGRVPGGFLKREGRPSDAEILNCRLVDRVLRPLFPKDYHADTQVFITLISYDPAHAPDSLAGLAASTAISLSDIPFEGPISECRVARIDGKFVVNPSYADLERADMDIMVGASRDSVSMVEGEFKETSEAEMLEAIKIAHQAIIVQIDAQTALVEKVGKSKEKREYNHETSDEALAKAIHDETYAKVYEVAKLGLGKHERGAKFQEILTDYLDSITEEEVAEAGDLILSLIHI